MKGCHPAAGFAEDLSEVRCRTLRSLCEGWAHESARTQPLYLGNLRNVPAAANGLHQQNAGLHATR